MKKINFYRIISKILVSRKMNLKEYITLQVLSDDSYISYIDTDSTISLVFQIGIEEIEIFGVMNKEFIIVDNIYRKLKKKKRREFKLSSLDEDWR